jgi:FtsP/CotA-like multicopper oxidase with cupredoxin domain
MPMPAAAMLSRTLAVLLVGASASATPPALPPRTGDALVPNDNRTPAGVLTGGVLTLRMVAREGIHYPDGPDAPGFPVFAFGEDGKPLQAPGPLIRVPAGTELRISVRNALAKPVRVRGLQDHSTAILDTMDIAPGATREIRFRANTPGQWFYWGRTSGNREGFAPDVDSHLSGAFIVDPPGAKPPANERVLVIQSFRDTVYLPGKPPARREVIVMNGVAWPLTERLRYTVGDTIRWRVLNPGFVVHPMHLHGFYFRVDSKGDGTRDTIYTEPQRRTAVTEFMTPGATMTMTWVPTRPGNWLFHCHLIFHIDAALRLGERKQGADGAHANHAENEMAGLVMGVEVAPRKGMPAFAADPVARRKLRVFANQRANVFGDKPGFSFILQEGAEPPAPDSIRIPSSTIVLHRGEPTEITVINNTKEMASTHWHGIELESFYDGVADWSGWGTRTAPVVAPGDSFIVRMTPDRAGTFIYHTHSNETVQLTSGLYGPLIVLPEGGTVDTTDRILLLGDGGPVITTQSVNGRANPAPIELRAGTTHRVRLINISSAAAKRLRLVADSAAVQWRPFAKDGYDLPPNQATARPAFATLGPGETMDFEVRREQPEVLTLEVAHVLGLRQVLLKIPVIVR